MDKESYFVSNFKNKKIGDDGAIIKNHIFSKDLFCEDIHFKLNWMSIRSIAKKSMLVNISDAIAMNSKPKYALIGIVIPSHFSLSNLKELSDGFNDIADKFGIQIIGGDTTSGKKLMISITIISESKKPLTRKSLKYGDLVAHTGILGYSKKGLTSLLRGGKIHSKHRFISPKLRDKFIYKSAKYLRAGLDISDGLSKDLSRLTRNKFGVKFYKKLSKHILCSGEEYEMLVVFHPKHKNKLVSIAKKSKTTFNIFGKICRGKYISICKEHHFN